MDIIASILIFAIFLLIIFAYSREKVDFLSISLLGTIACIVIANISSPTTFDVLINYIEFKALLIMLCLEIITLIARENNVLEWISIKMLRLSKGNKHIFLIIICITSTLLAAMISDVVVAIILAPIIIRICKYLKIKAGTYLLALSITINIGSIITPFSSGSNIIIAQRYELDSIYFIIHYWTFSFLLMFITIVLIDFIILRNEPKIDAENRELILELLDPSMVIIDKKLFRITGVTFLVTILLFIFISEIWIVALVSAMFLVLINNRNQERPLKEIFKEVNWEVYFFFMSLFVIVGCMQIVGLFEIFQFAGIQNFNVFIVSVIILVAVSLISGILANAPATLIFLPIVDSLIADYNFSSVPIIFALLIAVNLGGNILPQGSMCDVFTLKVAQDNKVENLNFRRLLINGALFALIHILFSILYLLILSLLFR